MNGDAERVDCPIVRFASGQWIGEPERVADTFSSLREKKESSRGGARKQIVLKHDPKAWEEGFSAGENRVRIPLRCPYPAGTTQAWSWHSGHVEGDAKRQGYSYSRGALSNGPSRGPIIL
jgi:hypothetical protein